MKAELTNIFHREIWLDPFLKKHVALLVHLLLSFSDKNKSIRNISLLFVFLLHLHPSLFHFYPSCCEVWAQPSVLR